MIARKSDVLSDQFRAEGNEYFRKREYYKALRMYNKVKVRNLLTSS